MVDYATIANDAITELKRIKGKSLRFNAPTYIAISSDATINSSNLWINLKNANIAVVILPYVYRVLTAEDSSAFILFIDDNGNCNDSIDINGWNLKFDTPKECLYRTYNRSAIISKGGYEITLKTSHGTLTISDFKKIWKYFKLISAINDDYSSLQLYEDLYDKEVIIETLREKNVRKEYERYTTEALLKANENLLEKIKQIINP